MTLQRARRYTFKLPPEIEASFLRTRGKRRKCSRQDFLSGYLACMEDIETHVHDGQRRIVTTTADLNRNMP